jgi:radical SAM protein with 4Fe4S-binding SPASM domain
MDLAITYRCNLRCGKCYVSQNISRGKELSTEQWVNIFEILWNLGIPQVVFTGGEPTLRDDLITLVSEAEEFVTGLVTNGTELARLAKHLKNASLDYVQITIESHNPEIHDRLTCTPCSHDNTVIGIRRALDNGLNVVTNTTLTKANASQFSETLKWLHAMGVKYAACNTLICSGRGVQHKRENGLTDEELCRVLSEACGVAKELNIDLQWYSPTCYNNGVNPIELGFGIKSCSAAAHNMTIQPDGSVLPCQSWPQPVGNILSDAWENIWNNPVSVALRNRTAMPTECYGCDFFDLCGGGCPLDKSMRKISKGGVKE